MPYQSRFADGRGHGVTLDAEDMEAIKKIVKAESDRTFGWLAVCVIWAAVLLWGIS